MAGAVTGTEAVPGVAAATATEVVARVGGVGTARRLGRP